MNRVGVDFDGTLYASLDNLLCAVNHAHTQYDIPTIHRDALRHAITPGYHNIEGRIGVPEAHTQAWLTCFRNTYATLPPAPIIPGARAFLETLHRHTGSRPVIITAEMTDLPERILETHGLLAHIADIYRVDRLIPKTALLQTIDVYVGDTTSDGRDCIATPHTHFVALDTQHAYADTESLHALAAEHPGRITRVSSLEEATQAVKRALTQSI